MFDLGHSAQMLFRRKSNRASEPADSADEVKASLQRWTAAQSRVAWRPIVATANSGDPLSRFCGAGLLQADEAVPTCKLCGRELQLFVQLDLGALPTDEFGHGVLQLFYCVGQQQQREADGHPDCWAEGAWAPFSNEASLVRIVPLDALMVPDRPIDSAIPGVSIVGWQPFDDAPDPEDHATSGLERSYDFAARTVTLRCPSVDVDATVGIDEIQVEDIASAADQDKLSGWPHWIQGAEYPSCPTCQKSMRLLFQIDSEDHIPYMFGDSGVGHITQCPDHHDVVAFGWACG